MIGDFLYAIRSLARSRGFTIASILTLSIGIGAATAIYSIVDTILLRPLPFPGGDRLVQLRSGRRFPSRDVRHFAARSPTPSFSTGEPSRRHSLIPPRSSTWRSAT
jgi:hypothetical protein